MTKQGSKPQLSLAKSLSIVLVLTLMILSLPISVLAQSISQPINHAGTDRSAQRAVNFETIIKERRAVKNASANSEKKMATQLAQLVNEILLPAGKSKENLIRDLETNGQLRKVNKINSADEMTQEINVYVYISWMVDCDYSLITHSGIVIEDIDRKNHFGTAWVSVDQLQVLSGLDIVQNIELVEKPILNTGSVLSKGDSVLKADLARSLSGNGGIGVKVGIISDGVDSASSAISRGDLPASLNILSNSQGGDEGTAMLEIVHDLAPGATLYFHDMGSNVIEFNAAIDDLANAGCSIICDDVGWLSEPFFEDGIVAQHIQQLITQKQIIYVSSAGNSANSHYQGQFYNDGNDFHDFSRGTQQNAKYMYATIPAGGILAVFLQWNEQFGAASSDYDLFLVDEGYQSFLASSEDDQTITKKPKETIGYMNQGSIPINVIIVVYAFNAPVSKILEINFNKINGTTINTINTTKADSIFGHSAVPGVIACGAANVNTPTQIENFSSQGPVTTLSGVRQKPDVTGVDGVAVTGAGGFSNPFYGTSASAPHIAAVAALVSAAYPSLTLDKVRQKILDTSVDLGTTGYDNIYGYGLVNALTAVGPAYQLTFDKNGGDTNPSPTIRSTIYNGTVALPTTNPTRTGYTFVGWNTKADGSGTVFTGNTAVTSSITVYAQWEIKRYEISFNSQNGSTVDPITADYNTTITAPADPTKTGCTFGGWYKDAACTDDWVFAADVVTASITLYAKWTNNSFTVTFKGWDGSILKVESVIYGNAATAPAWPSRAGYMFAGWDVNYDNIVSDLTVTAQYVIVPDGYYAVIFQDWDGKFLKSELVVSGGTATAPELPNRTGHTFTDWNKTFSNVTSNLEVTAQYAVNNYSVTFDSQNGSAVSPISADYNTIVTKPSDPAKTGYTFAGWYKDATCTDDWAFASDVVTADVTLYAKWSINKYTVTFNSQGGSAVSSKLADYKTTISKPSDPTKTGYTFAGWYKESNCTTAWNFSTDVVTVNTTLYAMWTPASAETKTAAFVTRFYQLCLNRDPDPSGLSNWVNDLQSGRQTGANVAYGFSFSDEFKNRNVSNAEYITIMYKAFFNRDPDAGGFNNWMDALNQGMSRYYVLAGFTNSQEFSDLSASYGINPGRLTFTDPADLYPDITKFVTRFYQQCLNRMPDPVGLNNWVRDLQTKKQTGANVAYGFVFSQEFQNKNVSHGEYVTIMYKAFFNRDPDPNGYNGWLGILNSGGSRHGVLAGFVNSQEFKNLCQVYNINPGILR